jgi:uridine phosphorylase
MMTAGVDMAEIAALVGDPGRANMLAAMLDGPTRQPSLRA